MKGNLKEYKERLYDSYFMCCWWDGLYFLINLKQKSAFFHSFMSAAFTRGGEAQSHIPQCHRSLEGDVHFSWRCM